MFNSILKDNIIVKSFVALVNFCNEYNLINNKELKYSQKMTLSMADTKKNLFFQSIAGDKIDCQ